jgi:[ribosomal protein S5]-alanine N-acetyltransferase
MELILLPIDIDPANNKKFLTTPDCVPILEVYPDYYNKVGFTKPWIGYFVTLDGVEIIGAGGYKGKPKNGKVEIAYGIFKKYEGRGIGTEICRQLVALAVKTDPQTRVTARTLMTGEASMKILKKNGFVCLGVVYDEDDGDVFEWEYQKTAT